MDVATLNSFNKMASTSAGVRQSNSVKPPRKLRDFARLVQFLKGRSDGNMVFTKTP